ncbi:hypothetical protein OS493_029166 [Desmophyllum pertusum]|uniref:Uncharacterized protein n=1 Tax=Desmophyllum pertusum TaxID=174260 RepID=A0A9W9ZXM1_9CNID|nr:hypothetical protein OS493_029166 [Desmophyllum pertusum]
MTVAMKDLLGENFCSAMLVLGGMVMAMHFELIVKHRMACPILYAVGPTKCGKTTALQCAAAMVGTKIWGSGTSFSVPAAMEQAHGSTMGYCIDDVKDDKILEEIVIDTYNQGGYVNLGAGRKIPKCAPLFTSNSMPMNSRINSRLAIIPFAYPKEPLKGMERMQKEEQLIRAMQSANQAVGTLIALGSKYEEEATQKKIYGELTEYVMNAIGNDSTRESVNYAELLGFTEMLCAEINGPNLDDLKEYFTTTIAPFFVKAVGSWGGRLHAWFRLSNFCYYWWNLPKNNQYKVIYFLNPSVQCNDTKETCVAICITGFLKASGIAMTEGQIKAGPWDNQLQQGRLQNQAPSHLIPVLGAELQRLRQKLKQRLRQRLQHILRQRLQQQRLRQRLQQELRQELQML